MKLAAIVVLTAVSAGAQPQPVPVEWERTPEVFAAHWVRVTLTGGTRVEGHWIAVTPDSFTMQVEKTSNHRSIAKGLQAIPRASIVRLQAGKRRVRGRIIGALAGFYGVAIVASIAARSGEAMQGPAGLVVWGTGIAGYFVGRFSDRAMRDFVIPPGDPPAR